MYKFMQKHKNLSSCESLSKQDVPFASRKSSTVQSSEKSVFLILNLYIPRSGPGGAAGAALDITANWEHRLHRDGDRAAAQLHLPGPDELRHGVATSPAVAPATLLQAPYYPQLFLILSPLHSPGWQGTTHGAEVATQALSSLPLKVHLESWSEIYSQLPTIMPRAISYEISIQLSMQGLLLAWMPFQDLAHSIGHSSCHTSSLPLTLC